MKTIQALLLSLLFCSTLCLAFDQQDKDRLLKESGCGKKTREENVSVFKGFREITTSYIKRKLSPEFEFYIVGCRLGSSGTYTQTLAINQDGKTFRMPADLTKILSKQHLEIETEQDASGLIETYFAMSGIYERIITKPADIPGYGDQLSSTHSGVLSKNQESILKRPAMSKDGDRFKVELYLWRGVGGHLYDDKITISRTGDMHSELVPVADQIGHYVLSK